MAAFLTAPGVVPKMEYISEFSNIVRTAQWVGTYQPSGLEVVYVVG